MKTLFKTLLATRVSDVTVDPVMNGSDTVMYLVNYPEGGWELLYADRRIPTRLMVGETGSMTLSQIEDHPGMSILLNDMRNNISAIKQSEQTEPVTEKGVFWDHISSDVLETRSDDILWDLYNTEVVYLDSTYVNHLIPTRWSQVVGEKEEYFQMNWGWSGVGDDNVYYIDSSNWSIKGSSFNMNLAAMV